MLFNTVKELSVICVSFGCTVGMKDSMYCTVRNCGKLANQYFNNLTQLQEKVDMNTKKIEE